MTAHGLPRKIIMQEPVTRRIKSQAKRKTSPGECVVNRVIQDDRGRAQVRTDEFHVQLGMSMWHFKPPVAVAGVSWIKFPIEGFVCVGCPPAFALQDAFKSRTPS